MKLRVRQLANGKWLLEAKRWHDFGWKGARIDRSRTTRAAAEVGVFDLPAISIEAPGSIHYPLTWYASEHAATMALNDARAILGA
jgi:hypothetical protein